MTLNGWRLEVRKFDGESERLGEHCGIYVSRVVVVISFVDWALLHTTKQTAGPLHSGLKLVQPVQDPTNGASHLNHFTVHARASLTEKYIQAPLNADGQ